MTIFGKIIAGIGKGVGAIAKVGLSVLSLVVPGLNKVTAIAGNVLDTVSQAAESLQNGVTKATNDANKQNVAAVESSIAGAAASQAATGVNIWLIVAAAVAGVILLLFIFSKKRR